jgi:hypothetical protein
VVHPTISIYDSTGVWVADIDTVAYNAVWTREDNAPHALELDVPYNATQRQYLTRPYELWLFDEYGNRLNKFRFMRERTIHGSNVVQHYELQDWLSFLADGYVTRETNTVAETPEVIMLRVLGQQLGSQTIQWGGCDTVLNAKTATWNTLIPLTPLRAIQRLAKNRLGSSARIIFNPDVDSLDIALRSDSPPDQVIAYRMNATQIERALDWTTGVKRIYAQGEGLDPENALEMDEGSYRTVASPGYCDKALILREPSFRVSADLTAAVDNIEAEQTGPQATYVVKVLDLHSVDPEWTETWMLNLELGRKTWLVDEVIGLSQTIVYITKIVHRLANPLDIEVTLDTQPTSSLTDILADMAEQISEAARGPLDLNNDGSRYPFMARMFKAADLTALAALPAANPGLAFRKGDFADLESDADDIVRKNDGSTWAELGGGKWVEYTGA